MTSSPKRCSANSTSTVEGNVLTYDEEVAKLQLIVATAADVWG